MKPLIIITVMMALMVSAQWPPQPQSQPQPMPKPQRLNFQQTVTQAKDELKHFLARDRPVTDSIHNMEEYYSGIKEEEMLELKPRIQLRRPCKVLPDPEPALVNTRLTEPTQVFHPLRKNEEFYGQFAPPLTSAIAGGADENRANYGIGQPAYAQYPGQNAMPPGQNAIPPVQQAVPVPVFMTLKETVYLTATPIDTDPYRDTEQDEPTSENFLAKMGVNWMRPTTTNADTAALLSSLSAMQSSMSAQSASMSSASAMAYFSSIAASLSSREAALSAKIQATANYNDNNDDYYRRNRY